MRHYKQEDYPVRSLQLYSVMQLLWILLAAVEAAHLTPNTLLSSFTRHSAIKHFKHTALFLYLMGKLFQSKGNPCCFQCTTWIDNVLHSCVRDGCSIKCFCQEFLVCFLFLKPSELLGQETNKRLLHKTKKKMLSTHSQCHGMCLNSALCSTRRRSRMMECYNYITLPYWIVPMPFSTTQD